MREILFNIKSPLITTAIILLGLFIYTKTAGPIPFSVTSVQTTKDSLFTTSGTGKATAAPNTSHLSLGVTETAITVAQAQSKLNTKAKSVIDALKTLGVEKTDIKTTNYSISPNYDFAAGQRITGYTASQNLEIKAKIELSNKIIDTATAAGANVVGGVTFVFDDKTKAELEDQARKEAVEKAKEKAKSLANASGIRLGKIIDVQESIGGQLVSMVQNFKAGGIGGDSTNVTPGENSIEITVTLSYETP